MKITVRELVELFGANKGQIIGLITNTDARAKKRGNPFGEIRKLKALTVNPQTDYAKAIDRRLEVDVPKPFVPVAGYKPREKRNKIEQVKGWPLGVHVGKNRVYFRCVNPKVSKVEYRDEAGNTLSWEEVVPWLPKKRDTRQQADRGLEGKDQVKYQDVDLDNVVQCSMGGQIYEVGER